MPLREILGKMIAFGLVTAALVAGGLLVLAGPHAYNDYFNTFLGWSLVLMGLATGGMGTLIILGVIVNRRRQEREHKLVIVPRPGPLGPPPPWGMGNVGRTGSGVAGGDEPRGGGGPRVMSVSVSNWDVPVVLVVLAVWTTVSLILLAPATLH